MNERIKLLAEQAKCYADENSAHYLQNPHWIETFEKKFAELIVRECVDKMLNSDDEHFMKQEGWDLGGPNHNAWTRGVLDSVAVVKEHFGVEE